MRQDLTKIKLGSTESNRSVPTIIKRYGSKSRFIREYEPFIEALVEEQGLDTMIDAFGGGAKFTMLGSIMENKYGGSLFKRLIYNDLDFGMYAIMLTIKSEESVEKLVDRLLDIEPSKELFDEAHRILEILRTPDIESILENGGFLGRLRQDKIEDILDRRETREKLLKQLSIGDIAYYQYIESNLSFSSNGRNYRNTDMLESNFEKSFYNRVESLLDKVEYFENVTVENMSYEGVIDKYKDAKALYIFDPPYVHETRNKNATSVYYSYEMTYIDHAVMLNHILKLPNFLLCGYDPALISDNEEVKHIYDRLNCPEVDRIDLGVQRYAAGREAKDSDMHEILWIKH